MRSTNTPFWLSLWNFDCPTDQRVRLWNGYLGWKLPQLITGDGTSQKGWPQLVVHPPSDGWPNLTAEEKDKLEELASSCGGHPEFTHHDYMDFSGHTFSEDTDFSQLILICSTFNRAVFVGEVRFSGHTRFHAQSWFRDAIFESGVFCDHTQFYAPVDFDGSHFKNAATFLGVEFMGGASFVDVVFDSHVMFNDSKFEERYFSGGITVPCIADFTRAQFTNRTSFREVVFGNDESVYSRRLWPERRADFSDAKFLAATSFRRARFGGVPAFFNAELHEDTDLGGIDWKKAETDHVPVDYAVRAWERLELMMNRLDKPLDRHQFFRLKMRARRRSDGRFLRIVNWLFDRTADYGWSVGRSMCWWCGHWTLGSLILLANTSPVATVTEWWKLVVAAFGTGFSNAHSFLLLTRSGGYLEGSLKLLEENSVLDWLTILVGIAEAILGPIFLFLVLLTLRNRFRLA